MTPEELDEAIGSGDMDRVVAVLAGATEEERRAASGAAARWQERLEEHWRRKREGEPPLFSNKLMEGITRSIPLVTVGTGPRPEQRYAFNADYPRLARILADRRPGWLAGWVLEAFRRYPPCWPLVYRLVREGALPQPDPELYTLGVIASAHAGGAAGLLRAYPDLLAEEIWRIFEVEGNQETSVATYDRFGKAWTLTLLELCREGHLPRERLLDASLEALARDFAQFRAGWFSRFHEELSPTLEEREARLRGYLTLLSSPIPPTVSFALKALLALEKAGRLPADSLLEHLGPALTAREKGTVTQALKLLDRTAKREPALAGRAAGVAVEALLHEAPEIQGAALDLIERHGDGSGPELRSLLEERLGDVAASQRSRVEALLGGPAAPEAGAAPASSGELQELEARAAAVPEPWRELAGIDALMAALRGKGGFPEALSLPFARVPRLDPAAALRPVESLDELIELFSTVLESPEPSEEIERTLDGLSRFCAERPEDFERRTGPLKKRAGKRYDRGQWTHTFWGLPVQDLAALALAWTAGELPKRTLTTDSDLDYFNGLRAQELARRVVERTARPLLALPTHTGGWIDPRVLVERVRSCPDWDLVDAVAALLRLAPDHRSEALAAAAGLAGELGDALRHALGASGIEIGPTAPLWAAAARARAPREDDPAVEARHPGLGPDAGRAARLSFRIDHETSVYDGVTYHHYPVHVIVEPAVPTGEGKRRKSEPKVAPDLPAVLHHVTTEQEAAARRWCATLWPAGRHAWFGRGVEAIGNNLDWWEAGWSNRVYLEALLEPDTPLCEMGRVLLCLGLGAKETGEASLSVDALIAAIRDGRIDAGRLGDTLATLALTGAMKGARWAKTLGEASRASALHQEAVREALERLVAAGAEMRPVDLGALLTLLQELCVECGAAVQDPKTREVLAGIKSGKSGTAAKALLQITDAEGRPHRRAALAEVLAARLERAERWMAWSRGA